MTIRQKARNEQLAQTPEMIKRRASKLDRLAPALIATPVAIIVTIVLAAGLSRQNAPKPGPVGPVDPLATARPLIVPSVGPVPVNAPSYLTDSDASVCTTLLNSFPGVLDGLQRRETTSHFALAWGKDPIIVECGVARPLDLRTGSTDQVFRVNGVDWLYTLAKDGSIDLTNIDRQVYSFVHLPAAHSAGLSMISTLIAAAEPRVCQTQGSVTNEVYPANQLCTNRP